MKEYMVTWSCPFEAESPEQAAEIAWQTFKDPNNIASVFEVTSSDGTKQMIDALGLEEY